MNALIIISITTKYREKYDDVKQKEVEYASLSDLKKKVDDFHTEIIRSDRAVKIKSICVVTE